MPRNNVPTVTSDIPRDLRHWIDRASEAIARNGRNRFVTLEELRAAGIVEVGAGDTIEAPQDGTEPTVFVPGAPTGLSAIGGYEYIILSWDRSTQYGIAFANIYRSVDTNFANAVPVNSTVATVYSDYVGTGQTYYYWVTYTNILDQEGPESGPVSATTAIDVDEVKTALTGQLTSTEFVDYLSTFLGNENYIVNSPGNYVVKVSAEGSAAGFGLATTDRDNGVEFDFAILADNFFITPPIDFNQGTVPTATATGQVWRRNNVSPVRYYISKSSNANQIVSGEWELIDAVPFIVRTTDTTITNDDGQTTNVPAGVYITSAYIQDGTITSAKIGTAAIDTAAIADAAITNAKIDTLDAAKITTGLLQSANYGQGGAGWRLAIGAQGDAVAVEFVIRDSAGNQAFVLQNGVVYIEAANIGGVLQSNGFQNALGYAGFQFDVDNDTVIFRATNDPTNEPAFEIDALGVATINAANIRHTLASVGYSPTSAGFELDVDNNTFVFQKSSTEYFKYENGVFETSGLTIKATDGTTLLSAGGTFTGIKLTNGTNLVYNGNFSEGSAGWVNWDPNNYEDATFSEFFGTATAASTATQGVRQVQDSFIKVVPGEDLYLYCISEGAGGWIAVEWFQDDGTGTLSYLGAQSFSGDGINRDSEDQTFDARKILRSVQITAPDTGATIDGTDLITADDVGMTDLIQINLNSSVVLTKQFTALTNVEGPAHYVRVLFGTNVPNVGTAIFYDVGLARVPPVLSPSYVRSYIRDLSVDTLQIANNAVTVPEGSEGSYNGGLVGYSQVELTDSNTRITFAWGDESLRPGKAIVAASVQAGGGGTSNNVTVQVQITDGSSVVAQGSTSFLSTFGGQTVAIGVIDLTSYTNSVTFDLKCRVFLNANQVGGTRDIYDWSLAVFGAKK